MPTTWTSMSTTRTKHAHGEVREILSGDGGKGAAWRPYTLPEMFAISVKPARLSAVGRFHNG
jgi:hypothetical protein